MSSQPTFASFQASEDSRLPLSAKDSEPSDTPKLNPSLAPSITPTFQTQSVSVESKTSHAIQSLSDAVSCRLSSLVAFLANRTASPESGKPLPMSAIYGVNASECLGTFDPASRCSRTSAACLPASKDFFTTAYCQTWPKFGLLVSGKLFPLPTLAHRIGGSGSGCFALTNWPTTTSRDHKGGATMDSLNKRGERNPMTNSLCDAVETGLPAPANRNSDGSRRELWRTASASDAQRGAHPEPNRKAGEHSLVTQTKAWATPTQDDANNATRDSGQFQSLTRQAGRLNPHWVACLMGYPPLWCELGRKFTTASANSKRLEMQSCHPSPKSSPAPSEHK